MIHSKNKKYTTSIERNPYEIGESIENKIRRAVNNNEPIKDTAPIIYTEQKDGVLPQFDIRTDRFELALDATNKYDKSERAKDKVPEKDNNNNNNDQNNVVL